MPPPSQTHSFASSPQPPFAPSPQAFVPSPQFQQPTALAPQAPIALQQPQPTHVPQPLPGQYNRDDESVLLAQKHAKWAISALNFEDVETAVKELRVALRALGAA
jgi:vacuolar protein sorting-associated protein VTA1